MSKVSVQDRLAEFRANKAKEDQRVERIQRFKGFFGFGKKKDEEATSFEVNDAAVEGQDRDEVEVVEDVKWSRLDVSIFCVKLALWFSVFMLAVHFEVSYDPTVAPSSSIYVHTYVCPYVIPMQEYFSLRCVLQNKLRNFNFRSARFMCSRRDSRSSG